MAIIGSIRKHSALAVIIVGVAIAAFVLSDLFRGGNQQAPPVGVIDGEEISIVDYNRRVDENLEIRRANQGVETLPAEEAYNVRVTTWGQYERDIIMGKEYEALGLVVTTSELFDLVQGNNPHRLIVQYFTDPQTNVFNPNLVLQFLQNLDNMDAATRKQWLNLEQYIKEDRRDQKYKTLISKGYYVPSAFARMDHLNKRQTAEIRYLAAAYPTVPDSEVTLEEKDYKKYYEENKYQYTQGESRDIEYVVFDVVASEEDREKIRNDVMQLYDEFRATGDIEAFINATSDSRYDSTWYKEGQLPVQLDSIMFNSEEGTFAEPYVDNDVWYMARLQEIQYRPDSMKAEHILISYQGAFRADPALSRTKEEAEALADSLLEVARNNKSRFPELAMENSDDPSAQENSGNLDWFADGAMVYPFNEAVIDNEIGDVVVAETMFGYHVIHITGKKEPVKKIRAAIIERAIEPSSQTAQEIYTDASRFAGEFSTQEKFNQAVIDQGMNKRTATYIQPLGNSLPGIENAREVIRWAYYDGIKVGEVSPVFDVGDKYIIAVLTAFREEGTIPLDQIRAQIETFVRNEKKAEVIKEKLQAVDGDLYQMASAVNASVDSTGNITFSSRNIPGFGSEYKVIGTIFALEPGTLSEPVAGNGAVFVIALDNLNKPAESSDLSLYKNQLANAFRSRVSGTAVFDALREKAAITDNRKVYL